MYEIGGFYRREQGLEVQVLSKSRCREQKRRVSNFVMFATGV